MNGVRRPSTILSVSGIVCKSLRVGSPDSKLGNVDNDIDVRIVIIFMAVCLRKSSKLTFEIGMSLGKKLTMSTSLTNLVGGKKHLTNL